MTRIAFATCNAQPDLFEEERELLPRLRARGVEAQAVSWTAPGVDWKAFDLVVVRSTWDYFERVTEFRGWLTRLDDAGVRLQNPVPVVRWNMDKLYLLDLAEQGVRIPPTQFVRPGESFQLAEILAKYGWTDAVVKPLISGGAFRTERVNASNAAALQGHLAALSSTTGAMVQPFLPEITGEGEWSLFFFGGAFSHAVLKTVAGGDYRVQPQFGGRAAPVTPPPELIATAQKITTLAPEPLLYARVDGVRRGDRFLLMELEAIEPYLFLATAPAAMDRYLDVVLEAARR
jgi:glutathione synthase/RimK-type ligase-like ATP-grasp enzyme